MTEKTGSHASDDTRKQSLAIDVEELRQRLGPVKCALIDRWIREVNGPFNAAIGAHVRPDARILDAGCSRGDPDLPALKQGRLLVGADVDLPGLRANRIADGCVLAPATALPFPDAAFDVVASKWVAEHLEFPKLDFAEFHRVLKPGGVLCLLTPNANSLFTLLSRAIPYRLKQVFKGRLFGVHEEDTFRTYYRANTRRCLRRLLVEAGFVEVHFAWLPGMWTFFIFNAPLAKAVRWLEHVQSGIPVARAGGTYILTVWRRS